MEIQSLYQESGNSNLLPLTISNFTASTLVKRVTLNWQTFNEVNVNKFLIEKSTNGETFSKIGDVKAIRSNYNSYGFTDNNPTNGINYYCTNPL